MMCQKHIIQLTLSKFCTLKIPSVLLTRLNRGFVNLQRFLFTAAHLSNYNANHELLWPVCVKGLHFSWSAQRKNNLSCRFDSRPRILGIYFREIFRWTSYQWTGGNTNSYLYSGGVSFESLPRHFLSLQVSPSSCQFFQAYFEIMLLIRVTSGFRRDLDWTYILLGCYASCSGKSLPMFRNNVSVPFWSLRMGPLSCSETSVRIYHHTLRNNPEGCRSQLF